MIPIICNNTRELLASSVVHWRQAVDRCITGRTAPPGSPIPGHFEQIASDFEFLLELVGLLREDERLRVAVSESLAAARHEAAPAEGAARVDELLVRLDAEPDLVGDTAGPRVDHAAMRARVDLESLPDGGALSMTDEEVQAELAIDRLALAPVDCPTCVALDAASVISMDGPLTEYVLSESVCPACGTTAVRVTSSRVVDETAEPVRS